MLKSIINSGKKGFAHGLFFAKKYEMAAKLLSSCLDDPDAYDRPFIEANLGMSLYHLGKLKEAESFLENVVTSALKEPELWDDEYSAKILEKTHVYLNKIKKSKGSA